MEAMNTSPANRLIPTVPEMLKLARTRAGFEQDDLADLIGVHRNSVGNYESPTYERRRKPSVIKRWAMACGFDPSSIDPSLAPHGGPDTEPDQQFPSTTCEADILAFRARRSGRPVSRRAA